MQWKRTIGWTLAALVILIFMVAAGAYFYLKSSGFQQFALRKIAEQAESSTGGKTTIGGLDFNIGSLTADLYNITVRGDEGPDQPPLLHADQLTVGVKIVSALHGKVSLKELIIDHPVIHVLVDRKGKNNFPTPPPSQNSSHTNVFDLGVEHAQITNGEIDYNDKKIPLEADLYDLGTDIHYAPLAKRYDGELSYKNGRLRYAQYAPVAHNFNVSFSATAERFGLESAVFHVGSSAVTLHAQVTNYSNPVADGDYQIQIHTQDFAQMSPSAAPAGDVLLSGNLHYQSNGNEPLLRSVVINGQLASQALSAATSGKKLELRKLEGTYQLAGGRLQVKDLAVDTLGGRIAADVDVKNIDATPDSHVRAALHGISLRAVQQTLGQSQLKSATLSGTLDGTAEAAWKGSINKIQAKSDMTLKAVAASKSNPSASEVPVNGAVHVAYDGARQTIQVRQTSLHMPSATITAQGEVSDRSNLTIQVIANDLHQLAALASSFQAGTSPLPAVSGSATLNAVVHGSMKKPNINGQLKAQNLQVQGSEWKSASLDVVATPSQVLIENGSLVNAEQGQATFSASVTLRDWSYEPSSPIKASLNAQRLRMVDLQRLANQHYPVSGDLSANISVNGSQLNPEGSGNARITNLRAYDEPVQNFAVQFHTSKGTIISTLNVAAPAGAIDANLSYTPKTKAYSVQLKAPSIVLQKLRTVQARNMPLNGTVSASIEGKGTVDDPQLNAVVQLPQLQIRDKSVAGIKADLRVAQHAADLNLDSQVSQASIHGRAHMALTGNYETDASIDTSTIPLDALLASYSSGAPQGFAGQTEFHATVKGPLKDKSRLQAHLSIPVLKASYQSLQIGITNPIRADYANSVLTLQPAEINGTGTSLRFQGRIPVAGNSPASLTAQGSIDVRILKIVAPDIQSSGIVALDVRSTGTTQNPDVQGQIQFKNVAVSTESAPVGVEQLNGTLDVTKDHVQFTRLVGRVGGGEVSVGGSVAYRPSMQFNLALKGQGVRLRYPEGLRTLLETNLAFSGTTEASTLNGRVLIDSLSFTPDFDLAKFGDQFSTGVNTPSQPGFADTVKLSIGVQSQESLNATSSQVSIAGRVALQVVGTAADPVITGRTNLTSGELFYRNVRYQLQKGVITFDDPNETHPVLNVTVTTLVQQYNLTLSLRGPLDKLTTEYTSDPPLATADVINLIARGKTTEQAAATSQSTDSMIASQAVGQLSNSVQKLAGISSLQIDPLIGGNNSNPSARVALQQRVTKNLLFTFSTDVSQPGSEMVEGEYQINKRWSVSVERDQLGGVSADGRYHTRF